MITNCIRQSYGGQHIGFQDRYYTDDINGKSNSVEVLLTGFDYSTYTVRPGPVYYRGILRNSKEYEHHLGDHKDNTNAMHLVGRYDDMVYDDL